MVVLLAHTAIMVMSLATLGVVVWTTHRTDDRVLDVAAIVACTRDETQAGVDTRLEDIHMLVNHRLDEALDRINLLESRLKLAGEEVPNGQD